MKVRTLVSLFFGLLAVAVAAAAVYLAMTCRDRLPVLLYAPEEATSRVEEMMDALCSGDFSAAAERMYGNSELGPEQKPEDPVNRAFWDAFVSSLDYTLVGGIYATDSGLAQDVKVISLELSTATENLGQRATALLQQGVEAAKDTSEIYDGANGYKEAFVESVITQAARDALEEDVRYTYRIVTLQLVHSEGQWWVVPNRELLDMLSGGIQG